MRDYLLNPDHPIVGGKARFFLAHGFGREDEAALATALIAHDNENAVEAVSETRHGTRYRVRGRLRTPDGRDPRVVSIWIKDRAEGIARLVTAYPN